MSDMSAPGDSSPESPAPKRRWVFFVALAVVSLALAGFVALFASPDPDGLERVAIDTGFAEQAEDSAVADSPLADYTVGGEQDSPQPWRNAAAGVIGVGIMAAVAFGVFGLLGRRAAPQGTDDEVSAAAAEDAAVSTEPRGETPHQQGRGASAAQP